MASKQLADFEMRRDAKDSMETDDKWVTRFLCISLDTSQGVNSCRLPGFLTNCLLNQEEKSWGWWFWGKEDEESSRWQKEVGGHKRRKGNQLERLYGQRQEKEEDETGLFQTTKT